MLKPQRLNEVWQLDLLSLRILWLRFTVAALMELYGKHHNSETGHKITNRAREIAQERRPKE